MKKEITVDGKTVVLQTNAFMPFLFKKEFKKDFFETVGAIDKNLDAMYELAWVMAKTADPNIPDFEEWLSGFEEFPLNEYQGEIVELVMTCITRKNANTATVKPKTRAKAKR